MRRLWILCLIIGGLVACVSAEPEPGAMPDWPNSWLPAPASKKKTKIPAIRFMVLKEVRNSKNSFQKYY